MQPRTSIDHSTSIVLPEPTWTPGRVPLRQLPQVAVSMPWEYVANGYVYRAFIVNAEVPHSELQVQDVLTAECTPPGEPSISRRGDLVVVRVGDDFYAAHAGYTVRRSDVLVGGVIRFSREVQHGTLGLPALVADPQALAVAEERQSAYEAAGRGFEADEATRLEDTPWGPAQPRCLEAA